MRRAAPLVTDGAGAGRAVTHTCFASGVATRGLRPRRERQSPPFCNSGPQSRNGEGRAPRSRSAFAGERESRSLLAAG